MAKKQTRRTVSLSRATYTAATARAATLGISTSEWITQLVREQIPELPAGVHVRNGNAYREIAEARWRQEPVVVHVPNATAEPPAGPTRAEIDAIAYARRTRSADIPAGTLCANCVDARATHRGHVDNTGEVYPLCDACQLPEEDSDRGYRKRRVG